MLNKNILYLKKGYKMRKYDMYQKILMVLSIILFVFTTILIYSKVELHSDILFLNDLYMDIFFNSGNWSDWKLTPAPAYFPDMILYFIGCNIFEFAEQRIMFVVFSQAILLLVTLIWLSKLLYQPLSTNGIIIIILMLTFVTLVISKSNMWFYFNSANNHYSTLLLSLLLLGLILKFLFSQSYRIGISIVFIGILAQISSGTFLLEFLFPALITIISIFYFICKSNCYLEIKKKISLLGFILVSIFILSKIIESSITYNNPMLGRTNISIDLTVNSIKMFLLAIKNAFLLDNYYTLSLSVIVLLSMVFFYLCPVIKIRFVFDEKSRLYSFVIKKIITQNNLQIDISKTLLLYSIPIAILGSIISGGFVDIYGLRYYMFPFALSMLIFIIWIDKLKICKYNWITTFIFIFLAYLVIKSYLLILKKDNFFQHDRFINSGASMCMKKLIENDKVDFISGVSDYWMARSTSYGMNDKIKIEPITNDLQPFFWMNTIGPLINRENYEKRFYNFLIIRKNEGDPFTFNAKTVGSLVPKNHKVFNCEESNVEIWYYDNAELDLLVKNIQANFLFKEKYTKNLNLIGRFLPGTTGEIDGISRKAKSKNDKEGYLIYGPYVDIEEGNYTVTLNYTSVTNINSYNGIFEIGRFDLPELTIKLSENQLTNGENKLLNVDINIAKEGLKKMEMRVFYNGLDELIVHSVSIKKKTLISNKEIGIK